MARWFWYFLLYSFLGYCLEKLYARFTQSPHQVRKCFLLLPLCPVYGLAMTACLLLLPAEGGFPLQILTGGALCTGVEYLVHWWYDRIFSVRFWDYTGLPGQLHGRVCPRFALIWGALSALTLRYVHPVIALLAERIPRAVSFAAWVVLAADCVLTWQLLRRYGDPELLELGTLLARR